MSSPCAQQPPVLVLRGVVKSLRVGVPGCHATARVLAGVDLVIRRGERVAIVSGPDVAARTLLLVAAGVLRPDAGDVWAEPGARLLRHGADDARVRGVAERPRHDVALLVWPGEPVTVIAIGPLSARRGQSVRLMSLRDGRLALIPPPGRP